MEKNFFRIGKSLASTRNEVSSELLTIALVANTLVARFFKKIR